MGKKKNDSKAFWYMLAGLFVVLGLFVFLTSESQAINYEEYAFSDAEIDNPDAEIVIEKFNDFQCPSCAAAVPLLTQVRENHDVHIQVRHFPLGSFPHSEVAAEASECARDQGRFWAMYYIMFDNQQQINPVNINRFAEGLGLDMDRFETCMDNREKQLLVVQDRQEGIERGVTGTPSIFINGEQVQFRNYAQYAAYISENQ